jgi:phosphate transport system substrate-binding protein
MGEDGYLSDRGLVPLPEDEFEEVVSNVRNLTPLSLAGN